MQKTCAHGVPDLNPANQNRSCSFQKVCQMVSKGILQSSLRQTLVILKINLSCGGVFGLIPCFVVQRQQEPETPAVVPSWMQSVDALNEAVAAFSTMEQVMKYLEPDRWQVDTEDLYKPTWQVVGKSFFHQKKSRGKDSVC